MTDAPREDRPRPKSGAAAAGGNAAAVRAGRPVTRLSRKVLIGLGAVAAVGDRRRRCSSPCSPSARRRARNSTTPTTASTPDGLASLPRDYTRPSARRSEARPAACPAISAGRSSTPARRRPACRSSASNAEAAAHRPGAGGGAAPAISSRRPMSGRIAASVAPAPAQPSRRSDRNRADDRRRRDLVSQDHKLAFLNGDVDRRTVSPDRVQAPREPLRAAGGRGHPGGADHRPALRSARAKSPPR